MAFSRKWLSAMGIEPEKIDEIVAAHAEVVEALKADRDKYKADAEQLTKVQGELDKVKNDLEAANATIEQAEKDDYKGKYEAIKAEKEQLKADYDAKDKAAKEDAAITELALAKGYGDKGAKMIVKYGNLRGKVKFDDKGKAEISEELWGAIESDFGDYKKPPETVDSVKVAKPPVNNGAKSTKTKAEIMEIKDAGERQKAIAENPELFGITVEE